MLSKRIDGFDMHYIVSGEGPPLVLVHGSFTDLRFWALQVPSLAERHRVVSVSMRPYWPNRQQTPAGSFSVPRYAADVAAFVAALDVGPVHLCGHSLGGHVALRVAQAIPSMVHTLVLAEPGGPLAPELLPLAGKPCAAPPNVMADAARLVAEGHVDRALEIVIDAATRPGTWKRCPPFYQATARANAATLVAQAVEMRPPITRTDIRAITQPVLLIGGADSPAPFPLILDVLEANLANASRVRIRNGTHLMTIENPFDFNAALGGFLHRHAATGRAAA